MFIDFHICLSHSSKNLDKLSDMNNTIFINYLYTHLEEAKSLFVPFLLRREKTNAKKGRADQIGLGSINQNKIFMVDYIF